MRHSSSLSPRRKPARRFPGLDCGEYLFFIDHLLVEYDRMSKGMSYANALTKADQVERKERRRAGKNNKSRFAACEILPAGLLCRIQRFHEYLHHLLQIDLLAHNTIRLAPHRPQSLYI